MKKIFKRTTAGAISLAMLASAAAALPITASADSTPIASVDYEGEGAETKFTASARMETSIKDGPAEPNTTKTEYITGSGSANGYGYYLPLTAEQAADKIVDFEFDLYMGARVANLSLSAGGSRAATTEGRALTFSYNANDGKVKIGNSETFGNVTTVGDASKWLHIKAAVNNRSKTTDLKVYNTLASGDYSSAAAVYDQTVAFSDATLAGVRGFDFFAPNTVGLYIDNINISTREIEETTTVADLASYEITGPDKMTFGPNSDTAAENNYSLKITDENGTAITSAVANSKVSDFNVEWDIDGFATGNDQAGQYCDSYGSFATNNAASTDTVFNLRNVPMNFYGKMTATITYNGKTYTAEKPVVALGNTTTGNILPEGGYPSDFDIYPDSLNGYNILKDTYASNADIVVGGWTMAGSDGDASAVITEESGNKFVKITGSTVKKSHVLTNSISSPATQVIFEQDVRFNSTGGVITLTSGYPFWSSSKYTNPVTVSFDGSTIKLNNTAITNNDAAVSISAGRWYKIVLSADKTNETAYALVYDASGNYVGGTDNIAWLETSNPTYYSVGMGNSNTGTIDFDNYRVYYPTANAASYKLTTSQDTLSIPNGDTADLAASLTTDEGYPITGAATWTVLEDDMAEGVIITPDENDSHKAKVTLANSAEAGTATVQVNIGGYTKTVELNITSSDESVKFTKSSASVSIPLDSTANTVEYAASIVDGTGADTGTAVTLAVYDKNNTNPYTLPAGITFDASTGILTVDNTAPAVTFTIRATGLNSNSESISKGIKVTVHGLSFDFGTGTDDDLAEGFTAVSPNTSYTAARGYGISAGTVTAEGTGSTDNAASDYLSGAMTFKANVTKGKNYTVDIVYQGTLKTGIINNDLAGYTLGTNESLAAASYTVPVPIDVLDLDVSGDGAKIASVTITKQADKSANAKPDIHHIGDSTAANNGSWAYSLAKMSSTYPELFDLSTFYNNGAGGRNLCTYYTEGKLASVLRAIEPGDIVMFGNNGTNGMGSYFESDANFYLDAAEAMGAKIIINSYTPHGAVAGYASGYNSSTNTFNCYRQDSYDVIVRQIAEERAASDPNYLGFVEIGKNADAIFTAYAADYAANGYASADAAAQAIIACFGDHNHYSNGTLARDLMLNGYGSTKGIVAQLVDILGQKPAVTLSGRFESTTEAGAAAVGYVAEYMQNNYHTQSVTWDVTHKTDANKYMKVDVEIPTTAYGTTVQLGLILEGNIDEVGEVTFTIN